VITLPGRCDTGEDRVEPPPRLLNDAPLLPMDRWHRVAPSIGDNTHTHTHTMRQLQIQTHKQSVVFLLVLTLLTALLLICLSILVFFSRTVNLNNWS
jgi:hypothetical protein